MREDNRNLLIAIALSIAVLLGWNYFYGVPQAEKQRLAQQAAQQHTAQQGAQPAPGAQAPSPSQAGGPAAPVPGTTPTTPAAPTVETREAALARSPRVSIVTPSLSGSINLQGGRIDDVVLKNYREQVDPHSPNIVLFSPSGSPKAYYAEFGFVGGQPDTVPGPTTVWTADSTTLTPDRPVTLTYDTVSYTHLTLPTILRV